MRADDCRTIRIEILDITVAGDLYPWGRIQHQVIPGAAAFWVEENKGLLEFQVFIEGIPAPEPRHRMGRSRPGQPIRAYRDPHDPGVLWRKRIVSKVREFFILNSGHCVPLHFPPDAPLRLRTTFLFPRIQAIPKKAPRRNLAKATKPDLDNLEKCVCDALTEVGIYLDDSRISASSSEKVYVAAPSSPMDAAYGSGDLPGLLFRSGVLVSLTRISGRDGPSDHRIWSPLLGLSSQGG